MRADQVVTQCPSPLASAVRIGSSQQILDEISPQPQLYLAGSLQMRKLKAEYGVRMLESDSLTVPGSSIRIN
jgi:hypothetical protein